MIIIIVVIVTVVITIIGEFIKLLLTLNDCYKFILVIVMVVIRGKGKHLKPSGEYNYDNYIIFLISYDSDFTCIVTVMNYDDDTTINENKSNDEVSDEYIYICGVIFEKGHFPTNAYIQSLTIPPFCTGSQ